MADSTPMKNEVPSSVTGFQRKVRARLPLWSKGNGRVTVKQVVTKVTKQIPAYVF